MRFSHVAALAALAGLAAAAPVGAAAVERAPSIVLQVDESQAPRRFATVHETIAVNAGPLTLAYPKWIPGEHGPRGPLGNLAVLHLAVGSTVLAWQRDPDDPFLFHTVIPDGASSLDVTFTTIEQTTISDRTLRVDWNAVVLYPVPCDMRTLTISPSLVVPPGWKTASALHAVATDGERTRFAPVSLERLVDSPLLASAFVRVVPLASAWPAELDITADTQSALDRSDDAHAFALFTNLVEQDRALFGYRHFERLHILVTQSESDPFDGLEHEDSPYNGVGADDLSKKAMLEQWGGWLLAHEQSHAWDGKYRRPAELYAHSDLQGPERTSLLWVYEGLNEYLGYVLATRAGFNDAAFMRDHLAAAAASFARESARATVPLVDTATGSWYLRPQPNHGWRALRRNEDYYEEAMLYWLEADAIIRTRSGGRRSLDDFVRAFFGQRDTAPIVVPYTREDVESALDAVERYDWHAFFERRIYAVNPLPPTGGIEAAGWRLTFTSAVPAKYFGAPREGGYQAFDSIGLAAGRTGEIGDIVPGSPADRGGLAPRMTILAVDGRAFTTDVLDDAIAKPAGGTIELIVRSFDAVQTRTLHYAGGLRYPHLERLPGTVDHLGAILTPRKP